MQGRGPFLVRCLIHLPVLQERLRGANISEWFVTNIHQRHLVSTLRCKQGLSLGNDYREGSQ